jgi:hypothetical protein
LPLPAIRNLRAEKPKNRCPITLLIDDPSPCINPLYYFASQVPKNAIDYHYTKKGGKWYFDSDSEFKFPIPDTIDQGFVHEIAQWISSNEVKGKVSLVPYPAGLGRVDQSLKGFPKEIVKDFISTFKTEITPKFDIGPELLTHTRALNLKTGKLISGISEHDWSQKQNSSALEKYIGFAFQILKNAGLNPTGVTSPCNFGMHVEGEYVKAILEAAKKVLGLKVVWYFLQMDSESRNVDHRVMYLDREAGEAVVSLVGSMNDPFRTSQITNLDYESWAGKRIDPLLTTDGKEGRIVDEVLCGSYITIMTHWQSLYSNGSRIGLRGLDELVSRINTHLKEKILWMRCSEIANYLACSASVQFRCLADSDAEEKKDGQSIEISSPFACKDFTFSFETDPTPSEVALGPKEGAGSEAMPLVLERATRPEQLKSNSWLAFDKGNGNSVIFVCLNELSSRDEKLVTYGATAKPTRRFRKQGYFASLSVVP